MTGAPHPVGLDPLARNASLRQALLFVLLATALVLSCFNVTDVDVGGHITVGREILKTGKIPSHDFFTHTVKGAPYPVHQWLGEVVMFVADRFGGATGLILLRMAIVLAGTIILYRLLRLEGTPVVVACGILLLLLVAMRPRFFDRPFLATMIFLPLLMTWIADVREGRTRRLWPILPLVTLWGHVHSSVVFAVLYLGGTLVGEGVKILAARRRGPGAAPRFAFLADPLDGWNYRRLVMFSAIAIALPYLTMAIVNPSGVKPLFLPFLFITNESFTQMILEYRRVQLAVDWPFDLVAGACILGCLLRPRRVDVTDLLLATGFGVMAFLAVREILSFAIVATPLLGKTWGSFAESHAAREDRAGRAERANALEVAAIVVVALACIGAGAKAARGWLFPFGFGKDPRHYPERAVDFLIAQNVRGPIFNTDVFASSLLWRDKGKRFPVFVDARLEAYPQDFWRDTYYRVLQAAPGWEDVLARYQVQCAILRREGGEADDRIGTVMWDDPRWCTVYWDDHAMIYVRRDSDYPRNRDVIGMWEFTAFDPRHPDRVRDLAGDELLRAEEEIARLAEWNPDSFLLAWTQAAAWTRMGRGEEALAVFERLRRRPEARGNAALEASQAEAALVTGDREAWAKLVRESGADPKSWAELFRAAALLAGAGARSVAIDFYRQALSADPASTDTMNNLALLLADDPARIDEALRLLDDAIARNTKDAYYHSSRGEVLLKAGREAEARASLTKALELLPPEEREARAQIEALLGTPLPDSQSRR